MLNLISTIYSYITKKPIKNSQAGWQDLSTQLEMLEDAPEPQNLKQKLISDARAAASLSRYNYAKTEKMQQKRESIRISYALSYSILALAVILSVGAFLARSNTKQKINKQVIVIASSTGSKTKRPNLNTKATIKHNLIKEAKPVIHKAKKRIVIAKTMNSKSKVIAVAKAPEVNVTIEYTDISNGHSEQSIVASANESDLVNIRQQLPHQNLVAVKQIVEKDGVKYERMVFRTDSRNDDLTREQL